MSQSSADRFPGLTGARFVAAFLVVAYHVGICPRGFVMVSFFFVLSGFVLCFSRSAGFLDFLKRRMARIYPLYLVGLILGLPGLIYHYKGPVVLALVPIMAQAWVPSLALVWNGPAWYVSALMFLYVLTPFFIRHPRVTAACAVLLPVCFWMPHNSHFIPLAHIPQFCLGIVGGLHFSSKQRAHWLIPAALCGAATVLAPFSDDTLFTGLLALPFLWLIFSLTDVKATPKWLMTFGESSYALYILHYPLVFALKAAFHRQVLPKQVAIPFLLFAVLFSVIATRLIEPPLRSVFLRLFDRDDGSIGKAPKGIEKTEAVAN